MISQDPSTPICAKCKYAIKAVQMHCERATHVVTGEAALCGDVRADDALCGRAGSWFERRMNISAIVDQASITTYLKDDGSIHSRTNQPIAENDKLKVFLPQDVNLDEWKRDDGAA